MARSMEPIKNVPAAELDDYNPEAFDAKPNPDGTFDLIPVRWMNDAEYMNYAYGCGDDYPPAPEVPEMPTVVELTPEEEEWLDRYNAREAALEEEAKRDAAEYERDERTRGPGAR